MTIPTKTPDTILYQSSLLVKAGFWLPPADPEADCNPRWAEVLYGNTEVTIRPQFERDPEVIFNAAEFLAVVRFVMSQGWLRDLGMAPGTARQPAQAPDAAGEEPAGRDRPEAPFPQTVEELAAGMFDPKMLRDRRFMQHMHHALDLSPADIGRLCGGITGTTVKSYIQSHGLECRSHRGRRSKLAAS